MSRSGIKNDLECLVVCEGSTDYEIIKGIVENIGKQLNSRFVTRLLAPRQDATSGTLECFGWTRVKEWCEHHRNAHNKGNDPIGALLSFIDNGIVLIQFDTDIAQEITLNSNNSIQSFSGNEEDRKEWCNKACKIWLGGCSSNSRISFLLTTWQLETWILAAFDEKTHPAIFTNSIVNYEQIPDVESKLINMGFASKSASGRKRLKKKPDTYRNKYLPIILNNISAIQQRCPEFAAFIKLLNDHKHK